MAYSSTYKNLMEASESALVILKKELPARFKADFQGTAHWYLSARVHPKISTLSQRIKQDIPGIL
jgi:hypothetical protein